MAADSPLQEDSMRESKPSKFAVVAPSAPLLQAAATSMFAAGRTDTDGRWIDIIYYYAR